MTRPVDCEGKPLEMDASLVFTHYPARPEDDAFGMVSYKRHSGLIRRIVATIETTAASDIPVPFR
jgi:hypothetical protein